VKKKRIPRRRGEEGLDGAEFPTGGRCGAHCQMVTWRNSVSSEKRLRGTAWVTIANSPARRRKNAAMMSAIKDRFTVKAHSTGEGDQEVQAFGSAEEEAGGRGS